MDPSSIAAPVADPAQLAKPATPGSQYEEISDRGSRIAFLDGLRGIAILLVIFHHGYHDDNGHAEGILGWAFSFHRIGWIGVDVFFVLSGFLITLISVNNVGKPRFVSNFFIRRTLRIFPVYYATLLVVFVLPILAKAWLPVVHHHGGGVEDFGHLWANALYLTGFSIFFKGMNWAPFAITWSLSVEQWFYMFFPFLLLFFRERPQRAMYVMIAVAIATRIAIALVGGDYAERAYYFMPARLDSIAIGGLAALVYASGRFKHDLGRFLVPGLVITLAAFTAYFFESRAEPVLLVIGYSVFSVGIAMIVLGLLSERGQGTALNRFLTIRWLTHLGKVSYGVYLFHIFIVKFFETDAVQHKLQVIADPSLRGLFVVAVTTVVATAIATLSFNLFEQPVMLWGRKFTKKVPTPVKAQAASSDGAGTGS